MPRNLCALELADRGRDGLELRLSGDWTLGTPTPEADAVLTKLQQNPGIRRITFDCAGLVRWDSLLLAFLVKVLNWSETHRIDIDRRGLPGGVRGMLALARAVPERLDTSRPPAPRGFLTLIGRQTLNVVEEAKRLLDFLGETTLALGRLLRGQPRFRRCDFLALLRDAGPDAVPIISLLSLLVGMILAFVGAVQLRLFGAQLFIADLVGFGMSREMGAMMTAIFMAGRTGAAYAAQLGTMQVNDEIDALRTSGFPPMDFLVLPRILALFATMPLLCLFSDAMGILGGAIVSAGLFDVSFPEYFNQIRWRLRLRDFGVGVSKCAVFAILVGIAGCMRGLQCQRSSAGVGLATTSAVVTGIIFIIVADALMTLIITTLGL